MKASIKALFGLGASLTVMCAPAAASEYHVMSDWTGGSTSWSGGAPSGDYHRGFNVKDNKADSRSVHGEYHWSSGSGGSLANSAGSNTTAHKDTPYLIKAVKSCTNGNYGLQPDKCSGWG